MADLHNNRGVISMITDFGNRDGYPGIVKGVIAGIDASALVIDITHEIPAFDVRSAAWVLFNSYLFFPERTVHLVVVDPAVGSQQRPLIVQCRWATFIGPDNGFMSLVLPHLARPVAYQI